MKSLRNSKRVLKKDKRDERKLLVDGDNNTSYGTPDNDSDMSGRQPNDGVALKRSATMPPMSTQAGNGYHRSESHQPASMYQNSYTHPNHKPPSPLPSKVNVHPMSSVSSSAPSSPSSPGSGSKAKFIGDVNKLEYERMPFNTYTETPWPWRAVVSMISLLTAASILVPCIVMVVIVVVVSHKEVRLPPAERQRKLIHCAVVLALTVVKDLILILLIISLAANVPVPSEVLAYPVILFLLCLGLVMTFLAFHIADKTYTFKYNTFKEEKKKALRTLSQDEKQAEMNKLDAEDKYFKQNYPMLAAVDSWREEFRYVKNVLNRKKMFFCFLACVLVCLLRFAVVFRLVITPPPVHNVTWVNTTGSNISQSNNITISQPINALYVPCVWISSVSSFLLSFFLAMAILYSMLWYTAILRECRYFNANEANDKTTVMNQPQASVTTWWKINETLNLFTSNTLCWSVFLGNLLYASCVGLVCLGCVTLIMMSRNDVDAMRGTDPLIVDNVFLYCFILIHCYVHNLILTERFTSVAHLQLKKLNISYEVASFVDYSSDLVERDSTVRSRMRFLRTRLALLQDLLQVVANGNGAGRMGSRFDVVNVCTFVVTWLVATSTIYALR